MENRIILKLWNEKNHTEKLELVKELHDYFKDGRSPQAFQYIDSLIIGLIRWCTKSSFQVSMTTLKILGYIAFAMKTDYQLYVKATFVLGLEELGHRRKEMRDVSRYLLVQLISHCTTEPQVYFDRIMNVCIKHWDLIWKEQGLEVICEIERNRCSKNIDIGKYVEPICALLNDSCGRIRTKAMQVLVSISHHIDKSVFCACALKYKISERKLRKLDRRLHFFIIATPSNNSEVQYNRINIDRGKNSMTIRKSILCTSNEVGDRHAIKIVKESLSAMVGQDGAENSTFSFSQSSKNSSSTASSNPSTMTSAAFLSRAASIATSYAQCKDAKHAEYVNGEGKNSTQNSDALEMLPGETLMQKLSHLLSTMKDADTPWNIQVSMLKEMQQFIQDIPGFIKEGKVSLYLENLEPCVILLLSNIQVRALVIKEVCSTVNCVCEVFQQKASKFGAHVIPSLMHLIPNLSTVISISAIASMRVIIKNSFSSIVLVQFHKHGFPSKSYFVRRSCADLLHYSLIHSDPYLISKWSLLVEKLLTQALRDCDHIARIFGRKAFWKYYGLIPARASNFFKTLKWNEQKCLAAEKIYPTMLDIGATRRFPILSRSSNISHLQVLKKMTSMITNRVFETASLWHPESDLSEHKLKECSRLEVASQDLMHSICSSNNSFPKQSNELLTTGNPGYVGKATEVKIDAINTTELDYFKYSHANGNSVKLSKEQTHDHSLSVKIEEKDSCTDANLESLNKIPIDKGLVWLPHTNGETSECLCQASPSTYRQSKYVVLQTRNRTQDKSVQVTCQDNSSIQCNWAKISSKAHNLEIQEHNNLISLCTSHYQDIRCNPPSKRMQHYNYCNCICPNEASVQNRYFSGFFHRDNTLEIKSQKSVDQVGTCVVAENKSSHFITTYLTKIVERRNCRHHKQNIYGRPKTTQKKFVLQDKCTATINCTLNVAQRISLPSFPINVALKMTLISKNPVKQCHANFTLSSDIIKNSLIKNMQVTQESIRSNRSFKFNRLYDIRKHKNKLLFSTNRPRHSLPRELKGWGSLTIHECLSNTNRSSFPVEDAANLLFRKMILSDVQMNNSISNSSSFTKSKSILNLIEPLESKNQRKSTDNELFSGQKKSSEIFRQVSPHSNVIGNDANPSPNLSSISTPTDYCRVKQWPRKVTTRTKSSFYRLSESSIETTTLTPPTSVLEMTPQDLQLHSSQRFLNLFSFS